MSGGDELGDGSGGEIGQRAIEPDPPMSRHRLAVSNSLCRARECAEQGDFVRALGWMRVLEAIGEELSEEDRIRCAAWRDAAAVGRSGAPNGERSPLGGAGGDAL